MKNKLVSRGLAIVLAFAALMCAVARRQAL